MIYGPSESLSPALTESPHTFQYKRMYLVVVVVGGGGGGGVCINLRNGDELDLPLSVAYCCSCDISNSRNV